MKIIKERSKVVEHVLRREFIDPCKHHGFAFPCDEKGIVNEDGLNPMAKANYLACVSGSKSNLIDQGVVQIEYEVVEPAVGICNKCGAEVVLESHYCGACKCSKCGQWYNVFGQALNRPSEWKDY